MQKEIIDRTEYALSTGRINPYEPFPLAVEEKGIDLDWLKFIPVKGWLTDTLMGALLRGMDLTLWFSRGYRKNIENFTGNYLFRTRDDQVAVSALFNGGDMKVDGDPISYWDVRVTFTNETALLEFLFSQDQDILNSLLENQVEVDGNLNYLYRFGYLARDLQNRVACRPHS